MVDRPRIGIATPARAAANNGNRHTAERWARHLAPVGAVDVFERWDGTPLDALVALHARKSADAVEAYRRAQPRGRLVLVMTGTDLYDDLPAGDARVRRSLEFADAVVVLQERGMHALPPAAARKARVVVQSCDIVPAPCPPRAPGAPPRFIAIGHLRAVKDPATLARAAVRLAAEGFALEVDHVGDFLDPALAAEMRALTRDCPGYRLAGGRSHEETLARLRAADALVHPSRLEGGANAVIEAVCAGVPVLASAVDGNLGLLGADYEGVFEAGDDARLAALLRRFAGDEAFAASLRARCDALRERFSPEREARAVRALVGDLARAAQSAAPSRD